MKSKGMLAMIVLSLPHDLDFTISDIKKYFKDGEKAIRAAINELIVAGYCSRQQGKSKSGKFDRVIYTFYEKPLAEKRQAEKRQAEKVVICDPLHPINYININNTNINNTNIKEKEKEKEKSEAFRLWLDYKRERGQEYRTAASEQCARERLLELSGGDEETALAVVKQSIANNWSGLFELKNKNYGNNKSNSAATNAVDRRSEQYRRLYERELAVLQSYEASD